MLPTTATAAAPPPPTAGPASSPSEPHAALLLALTYMRLRELLSCARTCRGLREAVAGDPLLALTDRAQGRLRSLHLLGCPRVSDAGLLRIVERNHDVTELFVPRCTGLTADGLVKIIHFLHGQHKGNLSRVRLHGICKVNNHHLDIIKSLMCRGSQQQDAQALHYNHRVHEVLNTDDGRPIDVDLCPLCRNVRLVFDCTRKNCREVKDGRSRCRGCFFCVARCETCGGCIDLEELGESGLACSDFLCMDCWLKLPKCCTCNRPYCERHSNLKENLSASGQFTCQECAAFATSLRSRGEGY
uniref:Uncharacterized protein n=1 Tax=Zea mays TaxID=4577 RepID=B4FSX1_MAIZE|nr:unknown [Zea mays]|eukprot:NP_001141026.1 uncharacterized LOC100273105 [Zea mays]